MSNTKTTQNYKNEDQRFEFVLYINNHIICQRYFHIPNFNEDSVNSLEMKELIDNIVGMYGKSLKITREQFIKFCSKYYENNISALKQDIQSQLNLYFPNVAVADLSIDSNPDKNQINVSLTYNVINTGISDNINITFA
jgi:hypothetical protein